MVHLLKKLREREFKAFRRKHKNKSIVLALSMTLTATSFRELPKQIIQ